MKMNWSKSLMVLVVLLLVFATSGCAKQRNKWASNGGFFATVAGGTNGDYIVISQSGGEIMDVWKLRNAIVQSASQSDGWLFRDNDNNPVNIGGDVKVIRVIEDDGIWDKYREYHMEFENQSYRDKFSQRE